MEHIEMEEKIICFGDIHGFNQAAESAIKLAKDVNAKAVFLGDYVDRGPFSILTLQTLIEAKKEQPDWVFLRGNHEQMLLDLIEGKANINDIGKSPAGEFDYKQSSKSFAQWQELNDNDQETVVNFLNQTLHYYETSQIIFLHAVLKNCGKSISEKAVEDLIWNYDYEPNWTGKFFIHGHLPVNQPIISNHYININTECGYGGMLTGMLIDKESSNILQTYSISESGIMTKTMIF